MNIIDRANYLIDRPESIVPSQAFIIQHCLNDPKPVVVISRTREQRDVDLRGVLSYCAMYIIKNTDDSNIYYFHPDSSFSGERFNILGRSPRNIPSQNKLHERKLPRMPRSISNSDTQHLLNALRGSCASNIIIEAASFSSDNHEILVFIIQQLLMNIRNENQYPRIILMCTSDNTDPLNINIPHHHLII